MPAIGNRIIVLNTIDSSNNYAMQQVHAGMAEHGQVWFALEQTAGKGQRGKTWKGTKAENILMSIVLETVKLTISQQFRLSATVAVAVRNFFALHAGPDTTIKWPNDLYWGDRKAGGILIENVIGQPSTVDGGRTTVNGRPLTDDSGTMKDDRGHLMGDDGHSVADSGRLTEHGQRCTVDGGRASVQNIWKWAVVGIGININQDAFPDSLPNPISLHHITQKKYEMMMLVNELCHYLEEHWQLLISGEWASIFKEYNQHLYKSGQAVRLRKNNVVMPCTIKGVSEDGQLLIAEDDTVKFGFGEVSWEIG